MTEEDLKNLDRYQFELKKLNKLVDWEVMRMKAMHAQILREAKREGFRLALIIIAAAVFFLFGENLFHRLLR